MSSCTEADERGRRPAQSIYLINVKLTAVAIESQAPDIKKILIVDDHADIRRLIRMTLEFEDYDIREAPNGEVALAMAQESPSDLVLLDVMMPGSINGLEVCRRLSAAAVGGPRVIMLSARGQAPRTVIRGLDKAGLLGNGGGSRSGGADRRRAAAAARGQRGQGRCHGWLSVLPPGPVVIPIVCPGTPVVVRLHLQDLQGFRGDLGLEGASLSVGAADLVAAVVDPQPLDLPALSRRHLPHGLARPPATQGRLAIVTGPNGKGRQRQGKIQQALARKPVMSRRRPPLKPVGMAGVLRSRPRLQSG